MCRSIGAIPLLLAYFKLRTTVNLSKVTVFPQLHAALCGRTTREYFNFKDTYGLPWGWNFNAHTHPIPTEKPVGIPHRIPKSSIPVPYTLCIFV